MKRVSQREETGSGWRERAKGKEEQSAKRLGLAKRKKKCREVRGKKNKRDRERVDWLRLREKNLKKKKKK